MSGIAAILHTNGRPVAMGQIEKMMAAMAYRGQDGSGSWHDGAVALGHCAFHTCAEDADAVQPLASEDGGQVLVMDGYLVNYADLRADLRQRGAALRNSSDAELVLHAYRLWGHNCLDHIDGEFAFVIYDALRREVFAGCDHTGLRQLHYHWDGTTLLAATDIAGVLAALPEAPPANLPYCAEHIANGWFTDNETPWQGIMRLPKAHCLSIGLHPGTGDPQVREYWQLPTQVTIRHKSDADYVDHYRTVFTECVAASARTHAPLACDVSGGLDSSAIFCVADAMDKAGELPAPGLLGFTLSAPAGTSADEREYVDAVARKTGREIEAVGLFCPDLDWFAQQGERDGRLPFLPNTIMLREIAATAAAKGCRVNLDGQGGDQWLDGHPHHIRQALRMRDWSALRQNLRADWQGMGAGWTIGQLLRQSVVSLLPGSIRDMLMKALNRDDPMTSGVDIGPLTPAMQIALEERKRSFDDRLAHFSPDDRRKQAKLCFPFTLLANDMLNLQTSQVGIENRHPMLSRKFIEFSASTPEHIRWRGGTTKFVHRKAMEGILPAEIINRNSKAHFNQTFTPHLSEMQAFCIERAGAAEFQKLVLPEVLAEEFTTALNLPFDRIGIWTLWGCYAVAAFLELQKPES